MNRRQCQQKKQLFDEYRDARKAHSEALEKLQKKIGTSSKADYEAMYRRAETLRDHAEEAKAALDNHIAGHECQILTSAGIVRSYA